MAHFARTRADWPNGYVPISADFNDIDEKTKKAINGDDGSVHAPAASVDINGQGLRARLRYDLILRGPNANTVISVASTRLVYLDNLITTDRVYTLSATGALSGDIIEVVALPSMSAQYLVRVDDEASGLGLAYVGFSAGTARSAKFVYLNGNWQVLSQDTRLQSGTKAQMEALDGMPDKALFLVRGYGLYYYDAASNTAPDGLFWIWPSTGVGRWIHELAEKTNSTSPSFIAAQVASGGKVPAQYIPNRIVKIIQEDGPSGGFSTVSTINVAVPWTAVIENCVAGDILIVHVSLAATMYTAGSLTEPPAGSWGTVEVAVQDGATVTGVKSFHVQNRTASGYGSASCELHHSFRRVVLNTGNVLIGTSARVYNAAHGMTVQATSNILVEQVRP